MFIGTNYNSKYYYGAAAIATASFAVSIKCVGYERTILLGTLALFACKAVANYYKAPPLLVVEKIKDPRKYFQRAYLHDDLTMRAEVQLKAVQAFIEQEPDVAEEALEMASKISAPHCDYAFHAIALKVGKKAPLLLEVEKIKDPRKYFQLAYLHDGLTMRAEVQSKAVQAFIEQEPDAAEEALEMASKISAPQCDYAFHAIALKVGKKDYALACKVIDRMSHPAFRELALEDLDSEK